MTGNANGVRLDRPHDRQSGSRWPVKHRAAVVSPVSITIHDPPMFAATVLSGTSLAAGIKVTGMVSYATAPFRAPAASRQPRGRGGRNKWQVIGIHETPIAPVLARCNKDSMNVYAESLCKRLGFEATQQSPARGKTWDGSRRALS